MVSPVAVSWESTWRSKCGLALGCGWHHAWHILVAKGSKEPAWEDRTCLQVIWSATSMKWIEVKMRELGISTHAAYKVSLFLDHQSMVTVRDDKHGARLGSKCRESGAMKTERYNVLAH